jgi:hypothetical protein
MDLLYSRKCESSHIMAEMIVAKTIKPSRFNEAAFWYEMHAEMDRVGKEVLRDFVRTALYWKEKPNFQYIKDISAKGTMSVLVGTDDQPYSYVNNGTSVRFATMTSNFRPKTEPGSLVSGRGAGKVAFINKKAPRPGIRARKFDEQIQKIWEKKFKTQMEAAANRACKASGHSI